MNKQDRHAIGVGVGAVVIIGLVIGIVLFLRGTLNTERRLNVVFENAYGIQRGELVQMAGVRVGQVDSIVLRPDRKAELHLGIHPDFEIPEGSRFTIKSGILGGSRTVEIDPGNGKNLTNGSTVTGDSSVPLDETLAETKKLVEQGQNLVASVQKITGDPSIQNGLRATLRNTVEITNNLKVATQSLPQYQRQINRLMAQTSGVLKGGQDVTYQLAGLASDTRAIARDARKVVVNLNTTVTGSGTKISTLLDSLDEAVNSVTILLTTVNENLSGAGFKEGIGKVMANADAASKNVVLASEKLTSIADKFDKMADNILKLTGEGGITKDIATAVTNLRETSASIRNLAARIEAVRFPWEKKKPATTPTETPGTTNPVPSPPPAAPFSARSLLEPGLAFDGFYDTTLERLRTDVDYTLLSGRNGFYRAGIADATESNRLNLEIGRYSGSPARFDYRYGIIASKLGVGFDFRPGPIDFRLDFYDPNRFTVDARAKVYLNKNAAIWTGISSIGKENRATIGIQVLK